MTPIWEPIPNSSIYYWNPQNRRKKKKGSGNLASGLSQTFDAICLFIWRKTKVEAITSLCYAGALLCNRIPRKWAENFEAQRWQVRMLIRVSSLLFRKCVAILAKIRATFEFVTSHSLHCSWIPWGKKTNKTKQHQPNLEHGQVRSLGGIHTVVLVATEPRIPIAHIQQTLSISFSHCWWIIITRL